MNKDELVAAVENGRDQFLESVERVPDELLTQPGVVGEWSVKDILTHISRWEAELVAMLFQAQRGRTPSTAQFGSTGMDELNSKWYKESKDRPLDRAWSDFDGVHEQLLRRLQDLTDDDLNNPNRYPWLRGKPLVSYIASDSFEHEAEHAAQIRTWRQANAL